jgi:LPS-assembly lipoprotein
VSRLRSAAAGATLALIALLTLTGCGFTPLYAAQGGVSPSLSAIEVVAPKGRTGFLLTEQLHDALATDRSAPPRYRLNLVIRERRYSRGLTVDNVAQRYENHITITYELVDLVGGKTLKAGFEPVEITYAASDQPYAGVAAQQDAQERAAADAAQRIRTDLGAYFAAKSAQ